MCSIIGTIRGQTSIRIKAYQPRGTGFSNTVCEHFHRHFTQDIDCFPVLFPIVISRFDSLINAEICLNVVRKFLFD